MGVQKIYKCDCCGMEYRTRAEALKELHGLYFNAMRKFQIKDVDSTDGTHMCIWCMGQIVMQAPKLLEGRVVYSEQK